MGLTFASLTTLSTTRLCFCWRAYVPEHDTARTFPGCVFLNPSQLEQPKGRVQLISRARDHIHVLNLRYAGTVEHRVYEALSLGGRLALSDGGGRSER